MLLLNKLFEGNQPHKMHNVDLRISEKVNQRVRAKEKLANF